ncbi:hypothetical protein HY993_00640 [Candidatus Micrarchaeota archaeon]|nr:hypothetical protein [Candidatus Micrarchaeota archaeon]
MRQIARLTNLSPPGASKIVARLKKEGLLSTQSTGVVENVFAAKAGGFLRLKACHNLLAIRESGLLEMLRNEYEEPEAVVLFGSRPRGRHVQKRC